MLPDKTSLYLTAIEDGEYKQEKISCEFVIILLMSFERCIIAG